MAIYRMRSLLTGVAGSPYYTNMYFELENDAAVVAAQQAVLEFWNAMAPVISSQVAIEVSGDYVSINPETGDVVTVGNLVSLNTVGTATGSLLPPATQFRITWLTDQVAGSRRLKGATYIPGLTMLNSDASGAPSGFGTARNAATAALLQDSVGFVVYSPTYGVAGEVIGSTAPTEFAVLRSRRD